MESATELFYIFLPWLTFLGLGAIFLKLFKWARRQKSAAIVFGALVQMFMPDPQVEKTLKVVQEAKQEQREKQDQDDKLPRKKCKALPISSA